MRILFTNPIGGIGGGEKVLLSLLIALRQSLPQAELYLLVCTDGALVQQATALGVKVQVLPLPERLSQTGDSRLKGNRKLGALINLGWTLAIALPELFSYLITWRKTIQHLKPDLIHSNGIKTHLLLGLNQPANVPVIWHIHDFYGSRPLVAKGLNWFSRRATAAIAISKAIAEDTQATLPGLPVTVIYNRIDTAYFSPAPLATAPENQVLRVGLVATFARWKGHEIFLAAAALVVEQRPDLAVQFEIVGGAIYQTAGSQYSQAELEAKATQLGIRERVVFRGFQTDIAKVYRELDIVVHASTQPEPFGLAIVEAMACGKPVIVSQAGGAAELFTDRYDALGVPPGDSKALAAAILELVQHPDLRDRLGTNARKTVLERFDQHRLGEDLLPFYAPYAAIN
uniref:Glycosyl transferase group 1 n=1 Tax=Cyanothece sp. (strain PCC 7425 / ATCC 29141) TaxID=395961 RepID=B8HLK4_CYAP4